MDTIVETAPTLKRLTGNNRGIVAEQFISDARILAQLILEKMQRKVPGWPSEIKAIVAVTRGGLLPALIVARDLGIRRVETFCVVSYNNFGLMKKSEIISLPPEDLLGDGSEGVLVVDDMTDSGRTIKEIREHMPKAKFATVYGKPAGIPCVDLYAVNIEQETWLHFPWDLEQGRRQPLSGEDS